MDNASYHSVNQLPKSSDKKAAMKKWLDDQKLAYPKNAVKKELWAIIKEEKKKDKYFIIDNLAMRYGHEVVRLPPYHPELNPIELVIQKLKILGLSKVSS
jgi:transposase